MTAAPVAEPAAHVAVRFTVAGVEPVRDRGSLIALAVVVIEVADVPFTLQGVQVHRRPGGGGVEVRSPVWRHPRTGAWLPGVLLPPGAGRCAGPRGGGVPTRFGGSSVKCGPLTGAHAGRHPTARRAALPAGGASRATGGAV